MNLRPYQQQAVDRLRASYAAGRKAPLFVLPTGGGKTFTFAFMTKSAAAKGLRVGVIVHRRELLKQASASLSDLGVKHGLIAPGFHGAGEPVNVASIQTLSQRLKHGHIPFDFIIYDEAHHLTADTWRRVHEQYSNARFLGVTATPCRTDGRGLGVKAGGVFDDLVLGPTVRELIELGFLVPPRVFAPPSQLDLSGVKRKGGDFDKGELAARADKPGLIGDAVSHYQRLCPGTPAVAFCVNIQHADHVAYQFRQAGVGASVIHGKMTIPERERVLEDLSSGKIQVMTSVDIVSEGFDLPKIKAAILLRPTMSLSLYLQQIGRALRPTDSDRHAFILDHAGNCLRHGLADEDRDWTLDGIVKSTRKSDGGIKVRQCEKCFAVFEWAPACPECGHENKSKERKIAHGDGELTEITREQAELMRRMKRASQGRAATFEQLQDFGKKHGRHPRWAEYVWRARQKKASRG